MNIFLLSVESNPELLKFCFRSAIGPENSRHSLNQQMQN